MPSKFWRARSVAVLVLLGAWASNSWAANPVVDFVAQLIEDAQSGYQEFRATIEKDYGPTDQYWTCKKAPPNVAACSINVRVSPEYNAYFVHWCYDSKSTAESDRESLSDQIAAAYGPGQVLFRDNTRMGWHVGSNMKIQVYQDRFCETDILGELKPSVHLEVIYDPKSRLPW